MRNAVVFLARRFLLSKSSDGFISLISWVSVVGVALGVVALIVVTSVINGFESELTRVISGLNGDVILYSTGSPVRNGEYVKEKINRVIPETEAVSASYVTELMISGPDAFAGAVLDGFEPTTVGKATRIRDNVVDGRFPVVGSELALGYALAEKIGAKVGDEIRLIAPFSGEVDAKATDEELLSTPLVIPAKVVGLVKMGMYQYDSKYVLAPLGFVQEKLSETGRVTSFKIKLPQKVDSFKAAGKLRDAFGYPLKAKNWGQLNKNLFMAIELEKAVIAVLLTAIIFVAAFNVVSTLMMMIHDKTREVSILKAMGFKARSAFGMFVLIGMLIGGAGTAIGFLLGMGGNALVGNVDWIDLPASVYHIDFLPVVVVWEEVSAILFFSVLVCFLATLYPAFQIARKSPLAGLRYE